jgi:general secretion pathway protein D
MSNSNRTLNAWTICLAWMMALLVAAASGAQDQPPLGDSAPATAPAPAPAPLPAPTPAPATLPAPAAATAPTNAAATVEATRQASGIIFNFRNAPAEAVLAKLSEVGGFVIMKDPALQPQQLAARVPDMYTLTPMSADEVVSLLNSVLYKLGATAVRKDNRILQISPLLSVKPETPVFEGYDWRKIPQTDELVTWVIPIRFADAWTLRANLQATVSPEATFVAEPTSNSIIITDTSARIRRVAQIISLLDTSLERTKETRVFKLQYASATATAQLINNLFRVDPRQATGGAVQQGGAANIVNQLLGARGGAAAGRGGVAGARGTGTGAAGATRSQVPVQAAADDRTNFVIVTGPPDVLDEVEKVIKELDSDPRINLAVFIYNLKYGQARNLEVVINNLFNAGTGRTVGGTQRTTTGVRGTTTGTGVRGGTSGATSGAGGGTTGARGGTTGGGLGTTGGALGSGTSAGFGTAGTAFATGTMAGQGRISAGAAGTAAALSGQVTVVANEDTNSLLVMTAPENWERVEKVLKELDRPVRQVLIKVLIAEVTHDSSRDLGAEFSVLNLRANGLGQIFSTDFNVAAQTGGGIVRILETDVTAALRALDTVGKLDVLSRPYILTSDNQLASILIGQSVPFITNSRTTELGGTINTIQYDDVGIMLQVLPHINGDGPDAVVIMDVAPEISALTGTSVPISETVNAPVFARRNAFSRVAIRNGQTIVIGGLMEDRKTETISKVPLLGDIPILGHAFKRTQSTKAKTELLIFLTPQVAPTPEVVEDISRSEIQSSKVVPTAVQRGAFQEHMDAMGRGATQPAHRE